MEFMAIMDGTNFPKDQVIDQSPLEGLINNNKPAVTSSSDASSTPHPWAWGFFDDTGSQGAQVCEGPNGDPLGGVDALGGVRVLGSGDPMDTSSLDVDVNALFHALGHGKMADELESQINVQNTSGVSQADDTETKCDGVAAPMNGSPTKDGISSSNSFENIHQLVYKALEKTNEFNEKRRIQVKEAKLTELRSRVWAF